MKEQTRSRYIKMITNHAEQQQDFRTGLLKRDIINMIRTHLKCINTEHKHLSEVGFISLTINLGRGINSFGLGELRSYEVIEKSGGKKKKIFVT